MTRAGSTASTRLPQHASLNCVHEDSEETVFLRGLGHAYCCTETRARNVTRKGDHSER